jgi:hypothetical protein
MVEAAYLPLTTDSTSETLLSSESAVVLRAWRKSGFAIKTCAKSKKQTHRK